MGLVILLIQTLRLLMLSFALALFKIAEVLEEHCNVISAGERKDGGRTSIGDSTSTNKDLPLKEPEGDEAGEPATSCEASENCAVGVATISQELNTAAEEPKAVTSSHQTEDATLEYSPQGEQSVPQISSDIRNLTAVPSPSSTCEVPSAAGAEPLRPLNYNPSDAFPHNKAISSVPILPSCSTGSLEGFTPEPDLQHDLTRCTGSDSNIQSVLGSPIWPESLSQKTLSESAISNRTFHATPIVPAHASGAASPYSEISRTSSDETCLPFDGEVSIETDQQTRNRALSQAFVPKTPESTEKRKARDHLTRYDSPGRDSGYGSATNSVTGTPNTAPRSDAMATPEIIVSKPGAQASCEHLKELHDMEEARNIWKKLLYYHPQWLVGGITLERLSTNSGHAEHVDVQLLVLDRQEGKYIRLSRALSSRVLRARTGLCLALYNTERGEYITQLDKALTQGTPLHKITATIHMWNRQTSLFENLADILVCPDWQASTGLRIRHLPSRLCTSQYRAKDLSWPEFVGRSNIIDYYLEILHDRGVVVDAQMDCYNGPMHRCLGSDDDEGMKLHNAFSANVYPEVLALLSWA